MNDKKKIDRLFQEKFKDFEVEPNEKIWVNIDAALREKKKKRVVPIWWKLGGIAAVLALGFFGLNAVLNNDALPLDNPVVIENNKQPDTNTSASPGQQQLVESEKTLEEKNTDNNTAQPSTTKIKKDGFEKGKTQVAEQEEKTSSKKNLNNFSAEENNAVATKQSKRKLNQNNAVALQENQALSTRKSAGKSKKTNSPSHNIAEKNNAVAAQNKKWAEDEQNFSNSTKELPGEEKSRIAVQEELFKTNPATLFNDFETIAEKKDSIAVAKATEPNALEELLKQNEEGKKEVAETKIDRWQISSSIAPIYFNSTSNGSPIDGQFDENSKSYENNLSFGLGVNYAVTKKLSVRTGINKFSLGYNTNDVVFFAALESATFNNLSSSATGSTIQVVSMNNEEAMGRFDSSVQNNNQGVMTQRMGYYEVPFEMSYKLLDRKFGINVIGGFSTLFLDENEITVKSSMMSASLGKANNLNDIHFSTNLGVGFRYRFWKAFEANFEPMFKYQINTFNKDAGNFKPYFIGLYSGVSFSF